MAKKKLFKQMRLLANKMPLQFTDGKLLIHGSELIKLLSDRNQSVKDKENKNIDPEKFYHIPVRQHVNHYKRIKKLFYKGGFWSVKEYVNGVIDLEKYSEQAHQALLANIPAVPMSV